MALRDCHDALWGKKNTPDNARGVCSICEKGF